MKEPIQQFRIYDPSARRYVYSGGTPKMLGGFFDQTATLYTVNGMRYERSTGYRDHDGNLVFEGDIVNFADEGLAPFAVEWEDSHGDAGADFGSGWNVSAHIAAQLRVLGNRQQNPELLSGESL